MKILVVDNYDSFVYNLVQYLGQLGVECVIRRNDEIELADIPKLDIAGILLSPGPGTPAQAGVCVPIVKEYAGQIPLFGVCLGHQAIAEAYGGIVEQAPELLHGKTSLVHHTDTGVLAGLPQPFTATRYHSLAVREDSLPPELEVTGRTDSGVIMALRHRELPIDGVQFHPESVLTQGGHHMLANWLVTCGYPAAHDRVPELGAAVEELRHTAFASKG